MPASPATHLQCSTARIWRDLSAASFCSCKLLWHGGEYVSLPYFNAQPDIFAVMNCCVVAMSLFSSDSLTWTAQFIFSAMPHEIRGVDVEKYALLCQETLPKRWLGNMEMTSNCDVTNSKQEIQMTTIWPWTKPPLWKFSAYTTDSFHTANAPQLICSPVKASQQTDLPDFLTLSCHHTVRTKPLKSEVQKTLSKPIQNTTLSQNSIRTKTQTSN